MMARHFHLLSVANVPTDIRCAVDVRVRLYFLHPDLHLSRIVHGQLLGVCNPPSLLQSFCSMSCRLLRTPVRGLAAVLLPN
jgi:hypothetical protein